MKIIFKTKTLFVHFGDLAIFCQRTFELEMWNSEYWSTRQLILTSSLDTAVYNNSIIIYLFFIFWIFQPHSFAYPNILNSECTFYITAHYWVIVDIGIQTQSHKRYWFLKNLLIQLQILNLKFLISFKIFATQILFFFLIIYKNLHFFCHKSWFYFRNKMKCPEHHICYWQALFFGTEMGDLLSFWIRPQLFLNGDLFTENSHHFKELMYSSLKERYCSSMILIKFQWFVNKLLLLFKRIFWVHSVGEAKNVFIVFIY